MRGCMQGLLFLLVIIGIVAGAASILLTRPSTLAQQLATVPVSTAAAHSFDSKIATLQAVSAPTTVEITEQEATSKLVEMLAADPSLPRIENPQIAFRDGKIIVSGVSHDAPVPIPVAVVGRVEARDGTLVTTVERIDTGRFPLPNAVQAQLTGLATNTKQLNDNLPIAVNAVQVLDGRLLVTGQPK